MQEHKEEDRSVVEIYLGDDKLQEDSLKEFVEIDPRIDAYIPIKQRLCFSHCMNNGGTSQLYIDFNPTKEGRIGQIIRFLHDPDSYAIIADSFDDYLQDLIDNEFELMIEK